MSSDKPLIHAYMPDSSCCQTRCRIDCYQDPSVEIDDESVTCPGCQAGLFHDLSKRTKGLELLVVDLKDSLDEILRRLGGQRSRYDD